jgi:peptidoglycan/LPS O-acetylase OafA/YrhL
MWLSIYATAYIFGIAEISFLLLQNLTHSKNSFLFPCYIYIVIKGKRDSEERRLFQLFQRPYSYLSGIIPQFFNWLNSVLETKQIKGNIHVLDGIRAIACLSVVMFHINLITTNDIPLWVPRATPSLISALAFSGDTGITLFFILSGFLLFLPYARVLLFDEERWPSMRQFYVRRILRILPVYYLSLILMVFIFHPQYLKIDHLHQWLLFLTMFMDSSATTYKQINGPFWTLAVEWQFYLLLPWIALAMGWLLKHSILKKRFLTLVLCLGILALWGIGTRFLGIYVTNHPQANIILPHAIMRLILPFIYGPPIPGLHGKFLEDFAVGMFISSLFVMAQRLPQEHRFHSIMEKISPWLFLSAVSLFIIMAMWKLNTGQPHVWGGIFDGLDGAYNVVGEFCFALSYGLFVTSIIFGYAWLRRPFAWKPLRWIGVLSYSIYMWHLIILENLTSKFIPHLPPMSNSIFYSVYWLGLFFIVVPLAFLFFTCIEKPGIRLGKTFRPAR